jgi:hypothetical protein
MSVTSKKINIHAFSGTRAQTTVDLRCRHAAWQFQTIDTFPAVKQGLMLACEDANCTYIINLNLVWCQEAVGGTAICFTNMWRAAFLQHCLGFDSIKPTLKHTFLFFYSFILFYFDIFIFKSI